MWFCCSAYVTCIAEARLAEIHSQRAELIEKRTQLRAEQAEQKKMLLEAVETMKKTKKWEAPPGVNMDIDMEGIMSKVQSERSAGALPAIRPSASTADVAASSSSENRPKSRTKEPSDASRAGNSLSLPQPPAVEKTASKTQQVSQLPLFSNAFFLLPHAHLTVPSTSTFCFATKGRVEAQASFA